VAAYAATCCKRRGRFGGPAFFVHGDML